MKQRVNKSKASALPTSKSKSRLRSKLALAFLLVALPLRAQTDTQLPERHTARTWVTHHFAKGTLPPFHFTLGGEPSDTFLRRWAFSRTPFEKATDGTLTTTATWTQPNDGLLVRCDITVHDDCQAVEWTLHFVNLASTPSPQLQNLSAIDLRIAPPAGQTFTLITARGSDASRHDFEPIVTHFADTPTQAYGSSGGRSSDGGGFPFFQLDGSDSGLMLSIGWTGNWRATFDADSRGRVRYRAGMRDLDLYLLPGEEIRTPLISLLFSRGDDATDRQNAFRRYILAHHTRRIHGEIAMPPFCGGFSWGDPAPCNEYSCIDESMAIAIVNRYQRFGIQPDVFWMDAGWTEGAGGPDFTGRNWYNANGTWVPDPERYPNGFRPISDRIHQLGSRFMVWFEPERVTKGSQFATLHPEWMLHAPGEDYNYLFNLGNPDACDWLCHYIGDLIEANGIDYYRQDFNMSPERYWYANDEPGRRGICEIRHIEGLYRYWDYLLTRFPEMQIDNCASGGRRLDLETTSRAIPLWRTDYQYSEPLGYQNHTYNLSRFLPLHGTGLYWNDDFNARSSFAAAMVINWKLNDPSRNIGDLQHQLATYRAIRHHYLDDYYPLTGDGDLTGDDCCLAYQYHNPTDSTGLIVAFRRGPAAPETVTVRLRALPAGTTVLLTDDTTGAIEQLPATVLTDGYTLTFPAAPSSRLLTYRLIP